MDIKILFSIISSLIGLFLFYSYLKDVLKGRAKPHLYTWIIWSITQGTATLAMWKGGGGWGAFNLGLGTIFVLIVTVLSVKYGTKNIKAFDKAVLTLSLAAVFVWWQLEQPLISLIMVSAIDFIGYLPSYRKTYEDPWSEPAWVWFSYLISSVFTVLALEQYNLMTLGYIVTINLANLILVLICLYRRKFIKKLDF